MGDSVLAARPAARCLFMEIRAKKPRAANLLCDGRTASKDQMSRQMGVKNGPLGQWGCHIRRDKLIFCVFEGGGRGQRPCRWPLNRA